MSFEKGVESTQTMLRCLEEDTVQMDSMSMWDVLSTLNSSAPTSRTPDAWIELMASSLQGALGWSNATFWRVSVSGDIELGFFHGGSAQSTELLFESIATREIDMDLGSALLVMPLLSGSRLLGVLQLEDDTAPALDVEMLEPLETIQRVTSLVLELSKAQRPFKVEHAQEAGFDVFQELRDMTSFEHAACHAGDGLLQALGGTYASLWLKAGDEMRSEFSFGRRDHAFHTATESGVTILGEGLVGTCWEEASMVVVQDVQAKEGCLRVDSACASGIRGGLFIPLLSRGEVYGVFEVFQESGFHVSTEVEGAYQRLGMLVGESLSRVRDAEHEAKAQDRLQAILGQLERLADGERVHVEDVQVSPETRPIRDATRAIMSTIEFVESELIRVVEAQGSGDLEARADPDGASGVFQGVLVLINQVLDGQQLQAQARDARATSLLDVLDAAIHHGDLTGPISVHGEDALGRLGRGLGAFFGRLRGDIARLDAQSQELVQASSGLHEMSASLESGSTESTHRASAASAASEEVSASLQFVSTSTEEVSANIDEISRQTLSATQIVKQAVDRAEQAAERVQSLKASGEEIGAVVKLIRSVADQTNLLALNATIEAARAGDAGKGFGVVANEVKELARETKRATEEISSKIETIQEDTRHSIASIEAIHQTIHELHDIQSTIATAVDRQNATTNGIRSSMHEATGACALVSRAIAQVVTEVERTQVFAGDTQHSAEALSRKAGEMRGVVQRFMV